MPQRRSRYLRLITGALTVLFVVSCAPAASRPSGGNADESSSTSAARPKVLNLGLRVVLDAFSIAASATLQGGGLGYIEMHSQPLFTADKTTGRPIPRILAEQPTLENGGLRIMADGKMISTYKLRRDVKWADGEPLTSRDLMFTFELTRDRSMPIPDPGPSELMEAAAAPDDATFVLTWKQPYYLADALGLTPFWPLPSHLLAQDYATIVQGQKDVQAFLARPYWTSEYVHVGPFKLVDYRFGEEAVFDAVDHYFLGRPRVDRIVVKQIPDNNTLLANILSGGVDLSTDNALLIEQGVELKRRWDAEGAGQVQFATGPTWFVAFQFDRSTPDLQANLLDLRVRQALYNAIDRDAYAEVVLAGIPGRGAHAMLSPENPLYSFVKDQWKVRYPYDPNRGQGLLEQAGWRRGGDGMLVNASGARLHIDTRTTTGQERKLSVVADSWRKLGVDPEEIVIPATRVRDREYRQIYPGVEITARGNEDVLLTRLECSLAPTAANRFSGNNRGHWCNDDFDRITAIYRATLREQERGPLIRQLQEVMLDDLPILLLNYEVSLVLARRGVTAFQDDFAGGADSGRVYGTYSRNAHEWDIVGS